MPLSARPPHSRAGPGSDRRWRLPAGMLEPPAPPRTKKSRGSPASGAGEGAEPGQPLVGGRRRGGKGHCLFLLPPPEASPLPSPLEPPERPGRRAGGGAGELPAKSPQLPPGAKSGALGGRGPRAWRGLAAVPPSAQLRAPGRSAAAPPRSAAAARPTFAVEAGQRELAGGGDEAGPVLHGARVAGPLLLVGAGRQRGQLPRAVPGGRRLAQLQHGLARDGGAAAAALAGGASGRREGKAPRPPYAQGLPSAGRGFFPRQVAASGPSADLGKPRGLQPARPADGRPEATPSRAQMERLNQNPGGGAALPEGASQVASDDRPGPASPPSAWPRGPGPPGVTHPGGEGPAGHSGQGEGRPLEILCRRHQAKTRRGRFGLLEALPETGCIPGGAL